MSDDNGVRAVGYLRVSTEEQVKHGWNLEADRERIEAIVAEKGWELIEVFDDGGLQGDDPDRPGFNRMLDTLDTFDVIIMRSLNRLSRDTYLHALATKAIRLAGVKVETFNGPVDLDSPEGELSANVLAAIARFEKRQIGVQVRQAVNARARAGHHHGRAPYGYGPGMTIIEAEAVVVRRIFQEHAVDGLSQHEIARRLNREGVHAERGHWSQSAISKLLNLPAYVGKVQMNGEVYDGQHEPIIDPDVWTKAQRLREAGKWAKRGKTPTANHLLAGGLLRCGHCGAALGAETRKPRKDTQVVQSERWEAYTCATRHHHGPDACPQMPVRRRPIDEAIWNFVLSTALDLEATKEAILEQSTAKLTGLQTLRDQAVRDQATAEARLTRVRRDYQDGKLTAEDWSEQRGELTEALDAAGAQVRRLTEQHADLMAEVERIDTDNAVLAHLTAIRASIMGEAKDGSATGVEAFRAALRRLFVGFELIPVGSPGGSNLDGVIWPQDRTIAVDGYVLIPHVRPEALRWDSPEWDLHRTTLGGLDARTPLVGSPGPPYSVAPTS